MITAVDTNVLIDVFSGDPDHGPRSRELLDRCLQQGSLVISDVVLAETGAAFASHGDAEQTLELIGATYVAPTRATALRASSAWREYRTAGGPRTRVVADFLVGAHALEQADRLLTRDRGFYRRYFGGLTVLDPSTA